MFYCTGPNRTEPKFALTRLFPLIGFQIITEQRSLEDLPCLKKHKFPSDNSIVAGFAVIATAIFAINTMGQPRSGRRTGL